jgi:hypothetical protein
VRQPGPTGCLFRCLERAETGATLLINSSSSGRTANNHIHSNTRRTRLAGAATPGEHVRRACDPGVLPAASMEHRVLTGDPTVAGNHRQRTRTTPTCSLPPRSAVGLPPAGPWKCRPTTGRAVEVPSYHRPGCGSAVLPPAGLWKYRPPPATPRLPHRRQGPPPLMPGCHTSLPQRRRTAVECGPEDPAGCSRRLGAAGATDRGSVVSRRAAVRGGVGLGIPIRCA